MLVFLQVCGGDGEGISWILEACFEGCLIADYYCGFFRETDLVTDKKPSWKHAFESNEIATTLLPISSSILVVINWMLPSKLELKEVWN